jgi:DNA-binding cell septation regulator SpoVG
MNFSEIKVWPLKKDNPKVKANGSFVIDEAIKVKFTLFNGPKGLFVGLPGKSGLDKEGKKVWYPDVSIISVEVQKQVNDAVLKEYNKRIGNTTLSQGKAAGPVNQVEDNDDGCPF